MLDEEEEHWPGVVLLDSTSFWRRSGGRTVPAFHVLAAYGYDIASEAASSGRWSADPWEIPAIELTGIPDALPSQVVQSKGRLLKAVAYQVSNTKTWSDFLASTPGMPEVVVADGGPEIRAAVTSLWYGTSGQLGAEFVACRWHWAKNLRSALEDDLISLDTRASLTDKRKRAREHLLWTSAERAFDSPAAWSAFGALAHDTLAYRHGHWSGPAGEDSGRLPATLAWLRDHDLTFTVQQARRALRPGPESVGPLEAELQFVRGSFARRAQSLRNRERTNLLLRLIVLGRRGHVNERLWAERIRVHLDTRAGHAVPQRVLTEHGGAHTL